MGEFVGRSDTLESVYAAWAQCTEHRLARLVVLEGHAGIGKTRVVQEFYGRLSAEQPEPPYWPPRLESDSSSALAGRSSIVPAGIIDWKPGQMQTFAWIGIACDLDPRTGQPERALIRAVDEATESHEPVVAPIGRRRRVLTAVWHLLIAWAVLGTFVAGLAHFGGEAGDRVGLAVGLVGAVASIAFERRTPRELRKARESIRRAKDDTKINLSSWLRDASKASLERADGLLRELRHRQIPAVIVVDNAQWADPDTVDLIDSLLQLPDAPVLVLATARSNPFEQQLAQRSGIGRLVREFKSKSEVIVVGDLSEDLLIAIVRERAPKTSRSVALALAAHAAGNPLVLGGLLEEDRISRWLVDGAYEIADPERVLPQLPSDYDGVLENYWKQLPFEVRRLLAVASLHGLTVHTDSVRDAYQTTFAQNAEPLIEQARDPHYWLDTIEHYLDRFTDGALLSIVSANIVRVASDDQIGEARRTMIGSIEVLRADRHVWEALIPEARRVLLKFYVGSAQEGFAPAGVEAARCAVELAELTDGPREAAEAASFAELGMLWGPGDDELLAQARAVATARHLECGHLERAEELLIDALRNTEANPGPDAEATWKERYELRLRLARIAKTRGRVREAITSYEELLADDRRIHVSRDLIFGVRNGYAQALEACGRFHEALAIFEQLVEDSRSLYGETSSEAFTIRNNLANCLNEAQDYESAVTEFRSLLADEEATRSADERALFTHRSNLASALSSAGATDEALQLVSSLVAESERILGAVHPNTLAFRNNLAACLAAAKRTDEATSQAKSLLADATEILGSDHPTTLICRYNLICWEQEDLGADEAIARLRSLISDQHHALEPDHLDTFRSRYHLAGMLIEDDKVAEGVAELRSLLAAQEHALGLDHRDTGYTHVKLVATLLAAGREAEADELIDSYMAANPDDPSS